MLKLPVFTGAFNLSEENISMDKFSYSELMKLGLIFSDKDMIKTESGNNIITKKECIGKLVFYTLFYCKFITISS